MTVFADAYYFPALWNPHDLASLYGVQTRALVQAVKRNYRRFPADFMF
jgi:hypothetical protein